MASGTPWAALQVLDLPPHVCLRDFADPCAIPHFNGAVLRSLSATPPNQHECVLGLLLTHPPLLEGTTCLHNLLQGEAFTLVWYNRSLPRTSHLLDLFGSCWWDNVLYRAPRWAPNVPAGWAKTYLCVYVTLTSRIPALTCAFPLMNAWKHKDKGRPRGRLHSDAQVNLRVRKHQNYLT